MNRTLCAAFLSASIIAVSCSERYDVIVYGGTPAGVTASRAVALYGKTVCLVCPEAVVGGVVSGGLGYTDVGNKKAIEGLSKYFFRQIGRRYGVLEQYIFEPHVAEDVFSGMLDMPEISTLKGYWIESVRCRDGRIREISIRDGTSRLKLRAGAFVDASYEGDLMAAAGVSYTVGRESRDEYGEDAAGVTVAQRMMQFPDGIDPYMEKGCPGSGLLPGIEDITLPVEGSGDSLLQAYCYRVFLTKEAENRIPFSQPDGYDPSLYELALRLLEARPDWTLKDLFIMRAMPCGKMEFNNRGGFSSDFVGANVGYPEASREIRLEMARRHRNYVQGLFYFYANDPRVPEHIRREMSEWGYCRDEHIRNGNFPTQLYIREARRMKGQGVATMWDCLGKGEVRDTISFGSYGMDSHSVRRVVVHDPSLGAMVKNEGGVGSHVDRPYSVSYSWIVPKKEECTNLVVPVCLSASHIAYSSLRVEPSFMVIGQAAGIAAAIASGTGKDIQDIPAQEIRRIICADADIIVDDDVAAHSSSWKSIVTTTAFGPTCLEHVGDVGDDPVVYHIPGGLSGRYTIWAYVQKFSDRNTYSKRLPEDLVRTQKWTVSVGNAIFAVAFEDEEFEVLGQTAGDWYKLGDFDFAASDTVTVRFDALSDGRIRADAIMLTKCLQ